MPADDAYEPGAAMRALASLNAELDAPQPGRLGRMKNILDQDEKTLADEKAAADAAEAEVHELQSQLAAMESESRRLQAILELEQMKNSLLGLGQRGPPGAPISAWGEGDNLQPNSTADTDAPFPGEDSRALSAADEARLARLMAEDDEDGDDDHGAAAAFASQAPSEMAATLAAMEEQLAALELRKSTQDQEARLAMLKARISIRVDSCGRCTAAAATACTAALLCSQPRVRILTGRLSLPRKQRA